jgi:hypothetical protein
LCGPHAGPVGILDRIRTFFGPAPAQQPMLALPAPTEPDELERAMGVDPAQSMAIGEALARSLGGWTLPRRGTAELLAAYSTTPWLHAVCRRRAEALSAVEWTLYRPARGQPRGPRMAGMRSGPEMRHRAAAAHIASSRLEQVTDHPLLDLLDHPTSMAPGPLFWELLSKWMDLAGEAPQAMVFDGGDVIELTPILPTLITQAASSERPWFEVRAPNGSCIRVPEDDMIWVREHDPADPYVGRGVGTAGVLADELETDEYMALTGKSLFFNQGAPKAFVSAMPTAAGQMMGEDAVKAFSLQVEQKHRGVQKAGQIHILNREIRVATLGQTLAENQYIDGRKFLRDTCMQVFGTPPEILGVLTASNRSTIDAADYLFAKFSTQPMLERLRAFYQALLVPQFGDDLVLDYVSPIPADKEFKKSVMIALPAAFTVNQVLTLAGEPTTSDGNRPYPASTGNVPAPGAPKKEPANANP